MLSTLFKIVGMPFVESLIDKVSGTFQAYFNKQISIEQLRAEVLKAVLSTIGEIERAHADALTKTYASFMETLSKSKLMQRTWVFVVVSQTFVLFWYQFAVPALVTAGIVKHYASAGGTIEWAYLLIGALMGMGPMILRAGPAKLDLQSLKGLIGR